MVDAIIRVKGKNRASGTKSLGHQLASLQRTGRLEGVKIRTASTKGTITLVGDFDREEVESALEHTKIPYGIEYKKPEPSKSTAIRSAYSPEYYQLQAQYRKLKKESGEKEQELSVLEAQLQQERDEHSKTVRGLNSQIRTLEIRAQTPADVEDFLLSTMTTEKNLWEQFNQNYVSTMKTAAIIVSEQYTSPTELEKRLLDYVPVKERDEYKAIKDKVKQAREVRELMKTNPLARLDDRGLEALEQAERLEREDKAISDLKKEINSMFGEYRMRIALTVDNQDTLVTLPFQAKSNYEGFEREFLDNLRAYLDREELTSETEEYGDLLRLRVKDTKTRKKNNLAKYLKSHEDRFTGLGGTRDVIEIAVH